MTHDSPPSFLGVSSFVLLVLALSGCGHSSTGDQDRLRQLFDGAQEITIIVEVEGAERSRTQIDDASAIRTLRDATGIRSVERIENESVGCSFFVHVEIDGKSGFRALWPTNDIAYFENFALTQRSDATAWYLAKTRPELQKAIAKHLGFRSPREMYDAPQMYEASQ